jgi:hypothetical protein
VLIHGKPPTVEEETLILALGLHGLAAQASPQSV